MNNFQNQQPNNQSNQQQASSNQQNNQQTANHQTQPNQANNQTPNLIQTLLNATLPALMQHFTGQPMVATGSNNSSDTQLMLSQILMLQQQILASQQDLNQRLVNLELSASQQLTSIGQQVQNLRSVRLSHSKETKQVDYSLQQANDPNKY